MGEKSGGKARRPPAQSSSGIQVRRKRNGQVSVTMSMPVILSTGVTSCPVTLIIASEDLYKFWNADRAKLGEDFAGQLVEAHLLLISQDSHARHQLGRQQLLHLINIVYYSQDKSALRPLQRNRFDAIAKYGAKLF